MQVTTHTGHTEVLHFAIGPSALGRVLVAKSSTGICAILLGDDDPSLENELRCHFRAALCASDAQGLQPILEQVSYFIEQPHTPLTLPLPLDRRGTEFQQSLWRALEAIELGTTASYSQLAKALAKPSAARAVARACAANPLAVVIPCHRVVRSDGTLAGYRWGVARKRWLLARERANSSRYSWQTPQ